MIPDLHDIGASYNVLPPGRYKTSFSEVQDIFVPNDNDRRIGIWHDFLLATEFLQKALGGMHSVWIGGSFTTSKSDPSDIDVTYVVKYETYLQAKENEYGKAALSILGSRGPQPEVFEHVDAYLITMPPTDGLNEPAWYMQDRGYWDQFWSKTRYDDRSNCPYPQRGYLEVIFDDAE